MNPAVNEKLEALRRQLGEGESPSIKELDAAEAVAAKLLGHVEKALKGDPKGLAALEPLAVKLKHDVLPTLKAVSRYYNQK